MELIPAILSSAAFSGLTVGGLIMLYIRLKLTSKYNEQLESLRNVNRTEIEQVKSNLQKDIVHLQHELELEKQRKEKELEKSEKLEQTVNHYTGVILLAAKDLQDRLWHLTQEQATSNKPVLLNKELDKKAYGSWPMTKKHYLLSTLFLFAQFFCWVEILKQEIRFLNFGDSELTNKFSALIKLVERSLAETKYQKIAKAKRISTDYPVFQMMQSELGCALIVNQEKGPRSMNFHEFTAAYDKLSSQVEGLHFLERLLENGVKQIESNFCHSRLKITSNSLVDLILFLKEKRNLVPEEQIDFVDHEELDFTKNEFGEIPIKNSVMR